MKKAIIIALYALVTVAAFGQTDTTQVEKKKKQSTIYVYGTISDSFTKAGIPEVKAAPSSAKSSHVS